MRPRVRGSLAVMLERYCAEHTRCRGGAIGGHGRPESTTEFRSSWPVRAPDVAVVQTERAARIDNRRVSIEVSGQWLFENAPQLERYRCLNPVIHAMPQIFSLSFTVSPRHYAARSR